MPADNCPACLGMVGDSETIACSPNDPNAFMAESRWMKWNGCELESGQRVHLSCYPEMTIGELNQLFPPLSDEELAQLFDGKE